ncbi:MAG: OmpW family outer membrane protein [Pseudomonadota bacterium]
MTSPIKLGAALLAAVAGLTLAPGALAQAAGQWSVKAGVGHIMPKVVSGDVSAPALPGTKADVSDDTQPVFAIAYSLTDHIALELDLGLPFEHELSGAGAIQGTGVLGTVKALPPTLFVQYRFFSPSSTLRPYAGVGATFAYFADETGSGQLTAISDIGGPPTTFKIKNKMAGTVQAGLAFNINARWFADLCVSKTFLKTRVSFSSGQTQDMQLDPVAVFATIGYKF